MKRKLIKLTTVFLISLFSFSGLSLIPAEPTFAAVKPGCESTVPAAVREANNCDGNDEDKVQGIITGILNAVILVSGLVSVVFVIIGGVNYMTSTGDSGKVEKAKKTIIYALIGLAVCALAFAIVNWVIGTALGQG